MKTTLRCPRCGFESGSMNYPAASRATEERDIFICGPCGSDEAVGRGVVVVAAWPIGASPAPEWEALR